MALYVVSLPSDALAFLLVGGLMRLLWGRRIAFERGVVWMELRKTSWFYKRFYSDWGATTFGHVVLVSADHLTWADYPERVVAPLRNTHVDLLTDPQDRDIAITAQLAEHELVHVEAYEAMALLLACLNVVLYAACNVPWWVCLLIQTFGGVASFLASNATAWLRGEHPYLGSHLEEAARAKVTCGRNPKLSTDARLE